MALIYLICVSQRTTQIKVNFFLQMFFKKVHKKMTNKINQKITI